MINKFYESISDSEYSELDAYNQSLIKRLLSDDPENALNRKDSKSLSIGTAFHHMILEPDKFLEQYIWTELNRNSKAFKEFASENSDKTILSDKEYHKLCMMEESLMMHEDAKELLQDCEIFEGAMLWESHGLNCKGRADGVSKKKKYLIDLKTSRDPTDFRKSAIQFGYDFQAAFYFDGLRACDIEVEDFYFIVVSTEKLFVSHIPYETRVYKMSTEFYEQGRAKYQEALEYLSLDPGFVHPHEILTI